MKNKHFIIEKQGTHKGINYNIKLLRMGHRCGYVEIPHEMEISDIDFSYESDLEVHGGITYADYQDGVQVIGFDAAHFDDSPDYETARRYFDYTPMELHFQKNNEEIFKDNETRTLDYMKKECISLIEQLLKKYGPMPVRDFNNILTQVEYDYMRLDTLATLNDQLYGNSYLEAVQWLVENEDITINNILVFKEEFAFTRLVDRDVLVELEDGSYVWSWEQ